MITTFTKVSRRTVLGLATTVSAATVSLGAYALMEPQLSVAVTAYRLVPKGWPAGLKLRVVVVADVHACEPWMPAERIAGICAEVNALRADIVLLLGDYVSDMVYVTGHVPDRAWARALATLRAPLGVHAILGNHDWWVDPLAQAGTLTFPQARRALEDVGIPVYSNRAVRLEKDGHAFWLAGIEDQLAILGRARSWRGATGRDDLAATLAQVGDDAPVLLMAHEPDIFPQVPDRVALTLCGHTHGGQVRLLGHAPIVPSRYGDRYAYGHIHEAGRDLIVSGGLGCSMLPIRFACPPEVNLIELGG